MIQQAWRFWHLWESISF